MSDIFELKIDETDIHFTSIHPVGDLKTLVDPRAYQLMAFLTGNNVTTTRDSIISAYFHYVYDVNTNLEKNDDEKHIYRNSTGINILIEFFKEVKFKISENSDNINNFSKLISDLKNKKGGFKQIDGKYYYGIWQEPKKGWITSLGLGGSSFVGLFEVTNPQEITGNNYSEIAKKLEFVMTEAMAREYVEYKWNFFMPLDYKTPSMRGGGRNITRRKKHKKILRSKYRRRTKCTTRR
jgi:hypothetical protein